MTDYREISALLRIMSTKGVGPKTVFRLLAQLSDAGRTASDVVGERPTSLFTELGIRARQLPDAFADAEGVASQVAQLGSRVKVLPHTHADYPGIVRSRLLENAPPVLFVIGDPRTMADRCIAIVGSRDASEGAIASTAGIARLVVEADGCVVSGMARGVDHAAHTAAIENVGRTVGVLVEGILKARIDDAMQESCSAGRGCVVSQFLPNARWAAHAAMTRNTLVVSLSRGVVVVAAGETGGTIHAGQNALRLQVPLAVVGNTDGTYSSQGCLALAEQGASRVSLDTLGHWIRRYLERPPERKASESQPGLF